MQQVIADIRRRPSLGIQPKLVLGAPDDRHEREADRLARQIGGATARASDGADAARFGRPAVERRPAPAHGGSVSDPLRQAIGQAGGGGRPVPAELRPSLEQSFGADFSRVRLHTDDRANELNHALQARAFTVGRDIFFRRGDYSPGSSGGRQLLAHELTHVVQQGGGTDASPSLGRPVIQRELTDEARKVLEDAIGNEVAFTLLPGGADALDFLDTSTFIRAEHVRKVMTLPTGAPAALESFVQACLLRYLAKSVLSTASQLGFEKATKNAMKEILVIKQSLEAAGYGPGGITPELHSMLIASFGALNLDNHDLDLPGGDRRKIEVCATFIPGRKMDILQRAHSFIIYTDATGKSTYISAHDDGHGTLHTESGPWSPTVFADPALERKVVATGAATEHAFPSMQRAAERIDETALKYKTATQNCNSATNYILTSAGLRDTPAPSTMTSTFGWSNLLETQINQRKRGMAASRPVPSRAATTTAASSTASSGTTTIASTSTTSTNTATVTAPASSSSTTTTTVASTAPPPSVVGPGPGSSAVAPAPQTQNVLTIVRPLRMNGADLPPGTDIVVLEVYEKKNQLLIQVHPGGPTGTVNADALDAATSMF